MKVKDFTRSVVIHGGAFHADEVSAVALLLIFDLIDKDRIYRTRDPQIIQKAEYVCDVGGIYDEEKKRFDHHQIEYTGPLSSVGMILLYLKNRKIITNKLYDYFNDNLIWGIDQQDNGHVHLERGICYFSDVIAGFLPIEYGIEKGELEKSFYQALDFCIGHLKRMMKRFDYLEECKRIVEEKIKQKEKVLIFEKPMSWQEPFFALGGENHPAIYVIMPTQNHWKLRGIPPSWERRMEVRKHFPKKWAGLHEKELQKVTQIKGAIFCHKGGFISIWKTKDDAIKAANLALEEKI